MYTYIYTEKPMEFYKEGRVLTIANGTTLDLSSAQYNHKAAIIVSANPAASTDIVALKFYSKGTKTAGVSFSAAALPPADVLLTGFVNNLIPVRLAEIDATQATSPIRVTLFN